MCRTNDKMRETAMFRTVCKKKAHRRVGITTLEVHLAMQALLTSVRTGMMITFVGLDSYTTRLVKFHTASSFVLLGRQVIESNARISDINSDSNTDSHQIEEKKRTVCMYSIRAHIV